MLLYVPHSRFPVPGGPWLCKKEGMDDNSVEEKILPFTVTEKLGLSRHTVW